MACVSSATIEPCALASGPAHITILDAHRARPLYGTFNNIPVLHSIQPEIVTGQGILVNTAPGAGIATENNRPLSNATYAYNGLLGVHMHHKYYPSDVSKFGGISSRGVAGRELLTLALIASNPVKTSVRLKFK